MTNDPFAEAARAEAERRGDAAYHGAFDGSRTRWLSSVNPHRDTGGSDEHR